MIKEVSGDILLSKADLLAHGISAQDPFDSGLALALRERWPSLVKDYRQLMEDGQRTVEPVLTDYKNKYATDWSPFLGAKWTDHADTGVPLAELTRNLFGELPGISMVIYGVVLVVIVMFLPRGIGGVGRSLGQLFGFKERFRV